MQNEIFYRGLTIEHNPPRITYVCLDGYETEDFMVAALRDKALMRKRYYENEMKNRNWLMRLFNIKPSMKFYDSLRG